MCEHRTPFASGLTQMGRFVLGWKMLGLERSLGSRIVTYAKDFPGRRPAITNGANPLETRNGMLGCLAQMPLSLLKAIGAVEDESKTGANPQTDE